MRFFVNDFALIDTQKQIIYITEGGREAFDKRKMILFLRFTNFINKNVKATN